jgi:hypothetical protein
VVVALSWALTTSAWGQRVPRPAPRKKPAPTRPVRPKPAKPKPAKPKPDAGPAEPTPLEKPAELPGPKLEELPLEEPAAAPGEKPREPAPSGEPATPGADDPYGDIFDPSVFSGGPTTGGPTASAAAKPSEPLTIRWTHAGYFEARYRAFAGDSPLLDGKDRHLARLGMRAEIKGDIERRFRVHVLPNLSLDLLDESLFRAVLEEGYLEVSVGPFELRVGWDAPTWGSTSIFNPVDVLATRDYREGILDPTKIGQPMAALTTLVGKQALTLYYLSPFVPPIMPGLDSPFFPLPIPAMDAPPAGAIYGSTREEWAPQAAARLRTTLGPLDLNLSYFYGYSRFPFLSPMSPDVFFPLVHQAGIDGQLVLGSWVFSWGIQGTRHPADQFQLAQDRGFALPEQRAAGNLGIERTFQELIGKRNLTVLLELLIDSDSEWFREWLDRERPPDDALRFFQNHLAVGINFDTQNRVNSQLTLSGVVDLVGDGDVIASLEYSERWFKHLTFLIGGQYVRVKEGSKLTALEQLTGGYARLRLNY